MNNILSILATNDLRRNMRVIEVKWKINGDKTILLKSLS